MPENIIKDLGDGLILRRAVASDTDKLVAFNSNLHMDPGEEELTAYVIGWVRDLMTKDHPTFDPGDFTIVEDTKTGKIVSSLNLINQTWSYGGIEFGVGRPELVGTHPEYRRRGLIRAQFEVVHQWSKDRGHKVQAITGIPYYYRQFEYEMCITLGGSRLGYLPHIPKLKDDEAEKYTFRLAVPEDIPFIMEVYETTVKRSLVSCVRDEAYWRYDLFQKDERTRAEWIIIETLEKIPVGFLLHGRQMRGPILSIWGYELKTGASYLDVTPSVIRYLAKIGKKLAEKKEDIEFAGYSFELGATHPVYDVLPERMPRVSNPYAWYMRVVDIPDFLGHIGLVLEKRMAESPVVGYTGDLKLSFFRTGVKLSFEKGKLKTSTGYVPDHSEDGDVLFPDLTFLRVLFGYTAFDELEPMFPDCYARNDHGRALIKFLFPKQSSNLWAIS
jgi:GNAT superfamily N-acetyltransferase